MPTVMHDVAPIMLSNDFVAKIRAMGVPKLNSLGSGRIEGRNSWKEADEAYKPLPMRDLNRD